MNLDKIPIGLEPPGDINVVIEVPLGTDPIKYELDKDSGALFVDRFLYTSMHYPCNYGFVPHTLSDDGDPVDVMCVGNRPLAPGSVLGARPVGVLLMEDEAGLDEKVLAVPSRRLTRYYDDVNDYTDLPGILVERITHFFEQYKALEPSKWVRVVGWKDVATALETVRVGIDAAKKASSPAQP
ncbi:MAG: inorganic diphosphatase [Pseudomonadota bacterium]